MESELITPVEVEWLDAQSSLDGIDINVLKKEGIVLTHSCGYLIHQDKEKIILSCMLFGSGWIKHYQIIPKGMVKKINKLEWVKK